MVGPWPLAPYHDHLQYIHHIHLMQWGQNRGVIVRSMEMVDCSHSNGIGLALDIIVIPIFTRI